MPFLNFCSNTIKIDLLQHVETQHHCAVLWSDAVVVGMMRSVFGKLRKRERENRERIKSDFVPYFFQRYFALCFGLYTYVSTSVPLGHEVAFWLIRVNFQRFNASQGVWILPAQSEASGCFPVHPTSAQYWAGPALPGCKFHLMNATHGQKWGSWDGEMPVEKSGCSDERSHGWME